MDPTVVSAIADSVTAAAALGTVLVAGFGLVAWRDQLKGRTEYDLARRLLTQTYRLREQFKAARTPMMLGGEIQAAVEAEGVEVEEEVGVPGYDDEALKAVYSQRWRAVAEAKTDLEVEALEAEVIWGSDESDNALQPLRSCVGDLFALMNEHVMRLGGEVWQEAAGRRVEVRRQLLGTGEEDALGDALDQAVERVEQFLGPHLEL